MRRCPDGVFAPPVADRRGRCACGFLHSFRIPPGVCGLPNFPPVRRNVSGSPRTGPAGQGVCGSPHSRRMKPAVCGFPNTRPAGRRICGAAHRFSGCPCPHHIGYFFDYPWKRLQNPVAFAAQSRVSTHCCLNSSLFALPRQYKKILRETGAAQCSACPAPPGRRLRR